MLCFSGEYDCKLDAKGRLVLPARLKAKLPEAPTQVLVALRGFEACVVLYPLVSWEKIAEKVLALNEFEEEYRLFQRSFLRGSTEIELDGQSRLLLPKTLLNYAQLEVDILAVGVGNRIELWNLKNYEQNLLQDAKEFSQKAQQILGNDAANSL